MLELFWENPEENGPQQKNDKTERARGHGRKTREQIGKGKQMTALRFQTGSIIHPSQHVTVIVAKATVSLGST